MWSIILYFLFGIGQPIDTEHSEIQTIQAASYGDGGETSTSIPPRPTKP
jgi:hypothetical protein